MNQNKKIQIFEKVIEIINSELALTEILEKIIEIVTNITSADSCLIYIYDDIKSELVLYASKNPHPKILKKIKLKIGEGITGQAALEKKPIVVFKNAYKDSRFKLFNNIPEDKYEAFLSVPIVYKNNSIGVINVQHRLEHKYQKSEVSSLFTIASQVGNAFYNAMLQEKEKQKKVQIETLSRLSDTIISGKYIDQILNLIVVMTAQMLNSKLCSIMVLDEVKNELIIKATQSLDAEYRNKPNISIDKSVVGAVIKSKEPIQIFDILSDKNYADKEIARKLGLVSMLAVPLIYQEKAFGVINLYSSYHRTFTDEEIKILQTIANQAAISIQNSILLDSVQKTKEDLENRKIIEKAKGIIMKLQNVSEDNAYNFIRKKSMDTCKPMKEIAQAIILFSEFEKDKQVR